MVRTLVYKKDLTIKDLASTNTKPRKNEIVWTHLIKSEDKIIDIIVKDIGPEDEEEEFKEDLIEKQRPCLLNFENFTFVNVSVPDKNLYNPDSKEVGLLQLSFIIKRNKIFSIANKSSAMITEIIENMKKYKLEDFSTTCIMSYVLEDLIEESIEHTEDLKKVIDKLQRKIIQANNNKEINETYEKLENTKETTFFTSKALRADIEVIREINSNKGKHLKAPEFDNHLEDRFLYCWDLIETQKDALDGTYNLYLAAQSNQMNKQMYKVSWIAAFLIIPTIVSGFFGMNVELPIHSFWIIATITLLLSTLAAIWTKNR
ncbi:magnesium transporter CorA family protein [Candidatus Woesearchaeota archaeon]|nr:magnesium transporter CorA family protein [Candidatus Woesearchaeota archaeon]